MLDLPLFVRLFLLNLNDEITKNLPSSSTPKLRYVAIFNPTLAVNKGESDDELKPQILCFQTAEGVHMSLSQQLTAIGLCQGVSAFSNDFNFHAKKLQNGSQRFIKMNKSVLIIKELEPNFHFLAHVDVDDQLSSLAARQFGYVVEYFHRIYLLLHNSLNFDLQQPDGQKLVSSQINKYWSFFLKSWNSNSDINPVFPWANGLFFKGFLGTFQYYKRSSINLNETLTDELECVLSNSELGEISPSGILVSFAGNLEGSRLNLIKNSGVIYSSGPSNITNLYSLLEWYEWTDRLTFEGLNLDIFEFESITTNLGQQATVSETNGSGNGSATATNDSEVIPSDSNEIALVIRNSALNTLEALNPMNLTQNLVVQPLTLTVQGVKSIGETTQGWFTNPFNTSDAIDPNIPTSDTAVENGLTETDIRSDRSSCTSNNLSRGLEVEEGDYLIGEKSGQVARKLVYIEDTEYALVVFKNGPFVISLLFDPGLQQLESPEFYHDLQRNTLTPIMEELILFVGTRSAGRVLEISNRLDTLALSTGSANTINTLQMNNLLADMPDFLFLVVDPTEGSIRSSLPYLIGNNIQVHRNAVFYLHDVLLDIFIAQGSPEFFSVYENNISEFYHKFTGENDSDWMIYYFRYHGKFIVVVKNRSMAKKRKRILSHSTLVLASSGLDEAPAGRGFLNTIAGGVSDYTNLGFLENLGDDVKIWLEGFSMSGET